MQKIRLGVLGSGKGSNFGAVLASIQEGRLAAEVEQTVWPWIAAGQLKPQIDKTFPLVDAGAAHAYLEGGAHVGKVMLIAAD